MKQPSIPVSQSELAAGTGVSRQAVGRYLKRDGAPQPDDTGRFDAIPTAAWLVRCHAQATEPAELADLRKRRMQLELAALERQEKQANGRLVDKSKIVPAIVAFNTQLTTDLQLKFESELPPKYEGKSRVERQQMNADAIDWVLRRLKSGQRPLTSGVEMPTANVIGEGQEKS